MYNWHRLGSLTIPQRASQQCTARCSGLGCWGVVMAHRYILGASGSGKSTLLKQLVLHDICRGYGVCYIDPHGSDIDELIQHIPRSRVKDTILLDPSDPNYYIAWNPLADTDNVPLSATSLSDAIKDAWGYHGMTTPVMDMFLYFTITTLMDNKLSFFDSIELLTDTQYRSQLTLTDTVLKTFWDNFDRMTPKEQREATASTLNKLYTLFGDIRIRRLFATTKGLFSVKDAVKDKILLVRLPQGQLGLSKVSMIGSVLLSLIHVACLSRDITVPYAIYVDEVHHFALSTIAELLSGVRKFNVELTVAHQYIDQLKREGFSALMGNCETQHIFRVSQEDGLRFQECKRNGPLCLHDLPVFRYRSFPWYPSDHDNIAHPLPLPSSPKMAERVWVHTQNNYCRGTR